MELNFYLDQQPTPMIAIGASEKQEYFVSACGDFIQLQDVFYVVIKRCLVLDLVALVPMKAVIVVRKATWDEVDEWEDKSYEKIK